MEGQKLGNTNTIILIIAKTRDSKRLKEQFVLDTTLTTDLVTV
jgi:hypothetical protein